MFLLISGNTSSHETLTDQKFLYKVLKNLPPLIGMNSSEIVFMDSTVPNTSPASTLNRDTVFLHIRPDSFGMVLIVLVKLLEHRQHL